MIDVMRFNFANLLYGFALRKGIRRYSNYIFDEDYLRKQLSDITNYAIIQSLYYRRRLALDEFVSPENIKENFQNIPLLEKINIRDDNVNDILVPNNKGYIRKTTGTTGIPVHVYVDGNTFLAQLASRWHFFSWYGLQPGMKEGRLWGHGSLLAAKNVLRDYLFNRVVFQFDQRDRDKFISELRKMVNTNPIYLYGYASFLLKVAKEFDNPRFARPQPRLIISTAEMLSESQREYISSIFGCPVVQEYGCSEVDIIAFECPMGRYHLNFQRLHVEFLESEMGENEVIITDLDNRCTPLLRYRLGDLVEVVDDPCPCGRPMAKLKRILGRTTNQLVPLPSGGFFHSVKFAHIIEDLSKLGIVIFQYRIEHISLHEIVVIIDAESGHSKHTLIKEFLSYHLGKLLTDEVAIYFKFENIVINNKHSYYCRKFPMVEERGVDPIVWTA